MSEIEFHSLERLRLALWIGAGGAALAALAGMFGYHDASVWRLPGALQQRVAAELQSAGVSGLDVEMSGQHAVLRGIVANEAAIAIAAQAAQRAAGPGGDWSGGVVSVDADDLRVGAIEQPFIWRIVRDDTRVVLSGAVPSEAARADLLTAANAAFPNAEAIDDMRVVGGAPSSNWTEMARTVVRALGTLDAGEARIADTRIALIGEGSFEAVGRLRTAYAAPQPPFQGMVVATVDGLDLANPALQGLRLDGSAESCANAIVRVTDAQPISFVAGSSAFAPTSSAGLAALASVALRCDRNLIEIRGPGEGGPTLSAQRAQAVVGQLARMGVLRDQLRASPGSQRRLDIRVHAEAQP